MDAQVKQQYGQEETIPRLGNDSAFSHRHDHCSLSWTERKDITSTMLVQLAIMLQTRLTRLLFVLLDQPFFLRSLLDYCTQIILVAAADTTQSKDPSCRIFTTTR